MMHPPPFNPQQLQVEQQVEQEQEEEQGQVEDDLFIVAKFANISVQRPLSGGDPNEIILSEEDEEGGEDVNDDDSWSSSEEEEEEQEEQEEQAEKADSVTQSDEESQDEDDNDHGADSNRSLPQATSGDIQRTIAPPSHLEPLPQNLDLDNGQWVDDALVVETITPGTIIARASDSQHVLDTNSLIFHRDNNQRQLVGRVDEVFGPVQCPYYTIPIMNPELHLASLQPGHTLSWLEQYVTLVNRASLSTRGRDAREMDGESNDDSEDEQDTSDEEPAGGQLPMVFAMPELHQHHVPMHKQATTTQNKRASSHKSVRGGRNARGRVMRANPSNRNENPPTPQLIPSTPPPNLPPGWPKVQYPPGWPAPKF